MNNNENNVSKNNKENKKKVFCFGNPLIKEDSLALKIGEALDVPGYIFQSCDSVEELLKYSESNPDSEIIILDVVKNLKEPRLLNIDDLKSKGICSLHDFDLSFFLQLLDKAGMIKGIKIIGIPMKGDTEKIKNKIKELIIGSP